MRITVITVNRNNIEGLRKTIKSVISQTERAYEFIVIDGASTDGGVQLLDEYAADITYKLSEPDSGIYNAMNKGVSIATGDYCIFMNSGDVFSSDTVLEDVNSCGLMSDVICGNAILLSDPVVRKKPPREVSMLFFYHQTLCHQAVFIRTEILLRHRFDEHLFFVSDRKLFLESLIFDNASYSTVDVDIVNYDVNGFSAKNRSSSEKEWEQVLKNALPPRILSDYGKMLDGPLFGTRAYERLFLELGKRNYRKWVYASIRDALLLISIIHPSARFINDFSANPNQKI